MEREREREREREMEREWERGRDVAGDQDGCLEGHAPVKLRIIWTVVYPIALGSCTGRAAGHRSIYNKKAFRIEKKMDDCCALTNYGLWL